MGAYEWQTVVLWCVVGSFVAAALLHVHRSPKYKDACLYDLISDEGRISSRKFMEFGGFIVSTVAVVVCVIRGEVPTEMVALIGVYATVFVIGRAAGQAIHTAGNTATRKAAINRWQEVDIDVDETGESVSRMPRAKRRAERTAPDREADDGS